MSLKEEIDWHLGVLRYHVRHIQVDKKSKVNGEDAIKVVAFLADMRSFEATYLKRLNLSNAHMAENFTKKLESVLNYTYEETE